MESRAQENAALVREFLTEVLAGGDVDALDIFLTDATVEHHPTIGEDGPAQPATGPLVCRVLAATDVEIDIEDVIAEGDLVAVRGTVTGSHQVSLVDVAPTGRTFEISYAWFFRIADGQIAEIWSIPDGLELQRALGNSTARRESAEWPQE